MPNMTYDEVLWLRTQCEHQIAQARAQGKKEWAEAQLRRLLSLKRIIESKSILPRRVGSVG